MSPSQFKAALKKLGTGHNRIGAAQLMGVTVRQNQRWATGGNPIPPSTELLIAALLALQEAGLPLPRIITERAKPRRRLVEGGEG